MNTLPNELIIEIFNTILKITDKRQFLKTCILYNNITRKSMLNYEKNYIVKDFTIPKLYCVEKFTVELCHDGYFGKIPEYYINNSNRVLIMCLSYYNCVPLLYSAKNKGCSLDTVINYGSRGGNIPVVKWGRNNGHFYSSNDCALAALNGHFPLVKWFFANGCERDIHITRHAAIGGHKYILQWLHENGCPWDAETCYYAASGGHLECLKYARENGCKWNIWVYLIAKEKNHQELLKWAMENVNPI